MCMHDLFIVFDNELYMFKSKITQINKKQQLNPTNSFILTLYQTILPAWYIHVFVIHFLLCEHGILEFAALLVSSREKIG